MVVVGPIPAISYLPMLTSLIPCRPIHGLPENIRYRATTGPMPASHSSGVMPYHIMVYFERDFIRFCVSYDGGCT